MNTRNKNPQYNLRIPSELKDYLSSEAAAHNSSLNAEITERLIESRRFDLFLREQMTKKGIKINHSTLREFYISSTDLLRDSVNKATEAEFKLEQLHKAASDDLDTKHEKAIKDIKRQLAELKTKVNEAKPSD